MSAKQSVLVASFTRAARYVDPPGRDAVSSSGRDARARSRLSPPPAAGQGSDRPPRPSFCRSPPGGGCPRAHLLARPDARRETCGPDSFQVTRRSRVETGHHRRELRQIEFVQRMAGMGPATIRPVSSRCRDRASYRETASGPATSVPGERLGAVSEQTADTAKTRCTDGDQPSSPAPKMPSGIAYRRVHLNTCKRGPASATTPPPILIARASTTDSPHETSAAARRAG